MPGRRQVAYAVFALIVVVLLNLPAPSSLRLRSSVRDNMSPFQNVLTVVVGRLRGAGAVLVSVLTHVDEKAALMQEVAELRTQLWNVRDLEQDNQELRRLMGFKDRSRLQLVLCEVIARGDTTGWWQTVRLNRGSRDGVRPDLAVITTDGLVGRTIEVSGRTAEVLLITDPKSGVACKFAGTEVFGIVRGSGMTAGGDARAEMLYSAKPVRMDYIPMEARIEPGAEVLTSGLGGVFPEGLLLGRVTGVSEDSSRLYRRAEVAPAADLNALHYAFVVMEPRAAEDVP